MKNATKNQVQSMESEFGSSVSKFKIEHDAGLPNGTRNTLFDELKEELGKLLPRDRMILSVQDMEKYQIKIQSLRSTVSNDINLKGRFKILQKKDADRKLVVVYICCVA